MKNTVKTLTAKNRMYTCQSCGKLTRLGNKDYADAEFDQTCSVCWDLGGLENAHEFAKNNGQENAEGWHFPEDCPFCK